MNNSREEATMSIQKIEFDNWEIKLSNCGKIVGDKVKTTHQKKIQAL